MIIAFILHNLTQNLYLIATFCSPTANFISSASSVQFYFETNRQTAVSKQKRMNVSNTVICVYIYINNIRHMVM